MLPDADIKVVFAAVHVNKGQNYAEFVCVKSLIG